MATTLNKKYHSKKQNTLKQRNVGFELTFNQFKTLHEKATVCDYTGEEFSSTIPHLHKSIERIDKTLPYRVDNCCVVTVKANQLKDMLEEDKGKLKIEDIDILNKIKHTLETKTRQQLVNKYFPDVVIGETDNKQEETIVEEQHDDIRIAQSYLDIGKKFDNFCMSFNGYKKLFIRKTCMVTKISFDNNDVNLKRAFIKKDESCPWNDENTMLVCNLVRNVRDSGITSKQLSKVFDI